MLNACQTHGNKTAVTETNLIANTCQDSNIVVYLQTYNF